MKPTRAFTMIDTLVCLSIIALIASLLAPTIIQAKESAKITVTRSNLRQIGLAIAMYRETWGGEGVYGNAWAMGLPCAPQPDRMPILSQLLPPNRSHPSSSATGTGYKQIFGVGGIVGPQWESYSQKAQDSSVIYVDPFFNPPWLDLNASQFYPLFIVAVRLDTSVFHVRRKGEWQLPTFWDDKEDE